MWRFSKGFFKSLGRPVILYLVTLSITIQVLFAGLIFVFEKDANVHMRSFFDAIYFTVTVMTGVGLGDIAPITAFGKVIAMIMMLAGTAIYVSFTAVLSVLILEVEFQQNKRPVTDKGDVTF